MNTTQLFTSYLKNLSAIGSHGDAREESYYPALRDMLGQVAQATGRPHIDVTILPKATDAGNPDFRLWNGRDRIVGYIEAKKPMEEHLDRIEESEQLRRHRETFPNLILTNFLHPGLLPALATAYGRKPTPEEVFHYVYPILYAPAYSERYAEFLRRDFPRVPFTTYAKLFEQLAALGRRLTELHLLRSSELDPPACHFEGQGDGHVLKARKGGLRYDPADQRVYINESQYFGPVPAEVWEYQIGGYQVCEKWLKDRAERQLNLEEIRTYCRIVTALGLTIAIQEEIDGLYPEVEDETVPCRPVGDSIGPLSAEAGQAP